MAVLGKRLRWTAIRTPDMNAYIERFNKSIEEECLNHIVYLSEEHLRNYAVGYLAHYNDSRPHQGIGNVPIGPWQVGTGTLHGLLKSFRRAATWTSVASARRPDAGALSTGHPKSAVKLRPVSTHQISSGDIGTALGVHADVSKHKVNGI